MILDPSCLYSQENMRKIEDFGTIRGSLFVPISLKKVTQVLFNAAAS